MDTTPSDPKFTCSTRYNKLSDWVFLPETLQTQSGDKNT